MVQATLFLLCSEGLSHLLQKAKMGKELTGVKISRGAPAITHLFFADDSLIFCKANSQEAGKLMKILKVYEEATGQLINMDKSSVFFSKNTTQPVRHEVCQAMGAIQQVRQGKYLGLPMIITKSKEQVFGFIRNSIDSKLLGWKNKLLNQAGKEVMLKAVAMAMPTYTMSCFRLPTKLCRDISAKMADYWWGESEGKKKMHWIGWRKMTEKKSTGGMGFRDLQKFNKALLAKQVWRLITQPNLLVSKVLKAKYYPKESIFNCNVPRNASWLWQSLSTAIEDVQIGSRRKVGNGKSTRIWEDNWIPDRPFGKPTSAKPQGCHLQFVSELMINSRWNTVLILRVFNSQDAERILKIPISLTGKEDSYYWMHSQNGQYTVQSGYKIWMKEENLEGIRKRENTGTSYDGSMSNTWKTLWKQKVSQKLKVFIWKCLHGGLPVRTEIHRRTRQGNPFCTGCGEKEETIEHLLIHCKKAKEIWKMAPVQWDGIMELSDCFIRWWTAIGEAQQDRGREDQVNLTINILWQIWKARNDREFNHKEREPHKIIQRAMKEWIEFDEANKGMAARKNTQETEIQQRTEPEPGQNESHTSLVIKIHTHQDKSQAIVGIGITATDSMGQIQAGWALRERLSTEPIQDQAVAVRLALLNAISQGWSSIRVELDNKELLESIIGSRHCNHMMATLIEDIQFISNPFHKCSFSFANTGKVDSIKLSLHALTIWIDEEWVNPTLRC